MASRGFALACLLSLSASLGCTALLGIDDDYSLGAGGAGGAGSTGSTGSMTTSTGANMTTGSGMSTGASTTTGSGAGGGMGDCLGKPDMCGDACVNLQTDPVNCGACGHECGVNTSCTAGLCAVQEVVADNSPINRLATDGIDVYWTSLASVKKAPVTGGMPPEDWSPAPAPWGIAVDANNVYWAGQGDNMIIDGGIFRRAKSATMATRVLTDNELPKELAINDTNVFWTCDNPSTGAVKRVGKGAVQGSTPITLYTEGKPPIAIAADTSFLYMAHAGFETVFRLDFANPNAVDTIADSQKNLSALALGGGSIAWAAKDSNSGQGMIMSSPKGTSMPMVLVQNLNEPSSVAFSTVAGQGYYYFTDRSSGTVSRVKADGSEILLLAEAQIDAENIAVYDSFVYWSVNDTSAILNPHRIRRVRK